jgi:choline-glycine betaine transporter
MADDKGPPESAFDDVDASKTIDVDVVASSDNDDFMKVKDAKQAETGEPIDLAEDDEDSLGDGADRYPLRETKIPLWGGQYMNFNWLTSGLGMLLLWGSVAYCLVDPTTASANFARWKTDVSLYFTWLYVGTRPIWMIFTTFIAFRYRNIRLGAHKNVRPDFDNVSYFCMIFSAGVAVGLFFFGVSEPLWHADSHRFAMAGYHSQDEIDQYAINLTLYHWGLAAWVSYVIVGLVTGIGSYRFGLPFTIRSTLYPLLGDYAWGWIGDLLDGFSIWVTVAGVCTSLGLGASQIVVGLQRLGALDMTLSVDDMVMAQVVTIIIITLLATCSVVSGLEVGIKLLSQVGFGLGLLLLFLVLVMDNTKYLFNLIVQSTGYYFQWSIFQLNFQTDAFAQLKFGEGRASDGLSAETWWMDAWTVFYMAWWTACSGFMGIFIARISKGRTVMEVVVYNMAAPLVYSIMWFCIFGGVGIRQMRQAEEMQMLGQEVFGDANYYQNSEIDYCYNVPQQDVMVNGKPVFTNTLPGVTPVCLFNTADSTNAWYNVMFSFSFPTAEKEDWFGKFMAGLSVVAVIIYFVTSSDSASLVVDQFASNGRTSHHWLQRVFWAFTEGAVACALLVAGGADALNALQAASVVAGLPFTLIVMYQCQALWVMCDCAEKADQAVDGETSAVKHLEKYIDSSFEMPVFGGIFNVGEFLCSGGRVHEERKAKHMDLPHGSQLKEFFIGLVAPFWSVYRIRNLMYPKPSSRVANIFTTVWTALLFFAWVSLFGAMAANRGFAGFAWACFFSFGILVQCLRSSVRGRFNLKGNPVEDVFASSFFYPQALAQMIYQFEMKGDALSLGDGPDDALANVGKSA